MERQRKILVIVSAVLVLFFAFMFRYEMVNDQGRGIVVLNRWSGSIKFCKQYSDGAMCETAQPLEKLQAEADRKAKVDEMMSSFENNTFENTQ